MKDGIDIQELVRLYKAAVSKNDRTGIDAAEVAMAEAIEAEAALARLATAEAFAAETVS